MITKFEALVARESLATVYASDGQSVTVVKIRQVRSTRTWLALAEYSDGSRKWCLPSRLSPSDHLLKLISNGTYREDSMTWHAVIDGKCVTQALRY